MEGTQSRWRSPVLWASIFATLYLILDASGVIKAIGFDNDKWNIVVSSIMAIMAVFGITNNPTASDRF